MSDVQTYIQTLEDLSQGILNRNGLSQLEDKTGIESVLTHMSSIDIRGREELPKRRHGWTQKVKINGQTVYLRTGEYADGRLGEIFLTMAKRGTFSNAMLNCFAMAFSMLLQNGVTLRELSSTFGKMHFEPAGFISGSDAVESCTSVLDWVFQELFAYYTEDGIAPQPEPEPEVEEASAEEETEPEPDPAD